MLLGNNVIFGDYQDNQSKWEKKNLKKESFLFFKQFIYFWEFFVVSDDELKRIKLSNDEFHSEIERIVSQFNC